VIVGLACLWYFTASEEAGDSGVLGPRYAEESDPGTISFTPRPDWYFYFLFYLLRIFKWPESVVLATVGIPTILLIILFLIPFVDRRRERRLVRRPVAVVAALLVIASMGVLTYKGATAKEALASENLAQVPTWQAEQNLPDEALPGARIFAQLTCLNCHSYLGTGGGFPGAPDLTEEGTKNRGIEWQIGHLQNPAEFSPGSPMPSFAALTDEQLRQLAVFLEASKGSQGGG
jgi:menaquinol-cytochrome c reductase cytochrome b/c subunit